MKRFGLDPHLVDLIQGVVARYDRVTQISIFGSRARGDYRPSSDIDLAVFGPTLTDLDFAKLKLDLDALPIIFKMDVVHVDKLGTGALRNKILGECVELSHCPSP
ncbi:MAG: nucleotidyltransferase domain-containing protein [Myxococcota bacterium]|jgi:proline iminopeptidase|nr:nucleotidyltransferase domain-containing protein [Myxococcota bacterium]